MRLIILTLLLVAFIHAETVSLTYSYSGSSCVPEGDNQKAFLSKENGKLEVTVKENSGCTSLSIPIERRNRAFQVKADEYYTGDWSKDLKWNKQWTASGGKYTESGKTASTRSLPPKGRLAWRHDNTDDGVSLTVNLNAVSAADHPAAKFTVSWGGNELHVT